jgi:tetratricopeptide (TPR) repeat protein
LELGDRRVRSAFTVSYRELGDQDARVFRFLGLYPGSDFSDSAVGELAAIDVDVTGQVLDRLARAHLVIPDVGRRFRMHDLLRLFAREMSVLKDSEEVRAHAMARLVSHFGNLLASLDRYLDAEKAAVKAQSTGSGTVGSFDRHEALVIFQMELPNVMAVFKLAADQHLYREVCIIFDALTAGLWLVWRPDDILAASRLAMNAARVLGDQDCEAKALHESGKAYVHKREFDRAVACHAEALEIYQRAGNAAGEARVLVGLGYANREMGKLDKAVGNHQKALEFSRQAGDRWLEQHSLNNLGIDYEDQEHFDLAVKCFQQGVAICRQIGDRPGEGGIISITSQMFIGLRDSSLKRSNA